MFDNLKAHVRMYFSFSKQEQNQMILVALIFGFILSFRSWGGDEFNMISGVSNWLYSFIVVIIAMFLQFSVQKIFAINYGYMMSFNWWLPGVLIGLLLTFITFGFFPFLFPNTVFFKHHERLRLGKFRFGTNLREISAVSIYGILANVFIAAIAGMLFLEMYWPWLLTFAKLNLLFAFYSLLPIPTISGMKLGEGATPGFNVFFYSKPLYIFIFSSVFAYGLLVYLLITHISSFTLLLISVILGGLAWLLFQKLIDNKF